MLVYTPVALIYLSIPARTVRDILYQIAVTGKDHLS